MTQLIPQADAIGAELLEKVVLEGDLKQLKPEERMKYVQAVCSSLGLNPLTRPFQYIELNRKLTLYATKDATEQLARINNLSLEMRSTETIEGQRIVVYRATDATGRFADASGVVSIEGLKGDALSNQLMKAETKASRRAVLRVCGLGWLDETETETIPHATKITVSDNGDIGNTTKTEIKAVSEPKSPVKQQKEWSIEDEFKPQPLFEDEVVEEEPQVDDRDVADLYWCPLHNEAWSFEKYKGYGHWITAERGHSPDLVNLKKEEVKNYALQNANGYGRYCHMVNEGYPIMLGDSHTGKIPKEIGINYLWLILGNTFNDANVAMINIFNTNNNVEDIKSVMDIHGVTTVGGLMRKAMDIVLDDDSIVWWE
tara:strand:- start:10403 stop:11515 length:1113 start_codon:yes stop_codon:yes gene_type:complete